MMFDIACLVKCQKIILLFFVDKQLRIEAISATNRISYWKQPLEMSCLLCLGSFCDELLIDIVGDEGQDNSVASILHKHFGFFFHVSSSSDFHFTEIDQYCLNNRMYRVTVTFAGNVGFKSIVSTIFIHASRLYINQRVAYSWRALSKRK